MMPNTIALSSTLPRVKNKTFDENDENISYSKSADFKKNRTSWPLSEMVECVADEQVNHIISPLENDNETRIVNLAESRKENETIFQTQNLQLDCKNESYSNGSTKNILKIVLPLVSENVPLNFQSKTIDHDQLLEDESYIVLNNSPLQYSPISTDMPVSVNKHINHRNHSLPEDSELNRFSSTFENIKTLLKEGLVDGLDEMPPDFQPPNPPILYRVSSLPNLLSYDSTKNHHSCSYLTMCATKHELFMNKLCKNIVSKHDMSVQVSTELFKTQNEKILVDTSCQTDDIYISCPVKDEILTKEINHNACHSTNNIVNGKLEIKVNKDDEIKSTIKDNSTSTDYTNTNISNKEYELNTDVENDYPSISYTNINVFDTEQKIKTTVEDDCASFDYSDVNTFNKEREINANEEDFTSIGYININVYNKEKLKTVTEDIFNDIKCSKIPTPSIESEVKLNNEDCTNINYTNIDVVDNGNKASVDEELNSQMSYTNINVFGNELGVKTNGEDCVDIGYSNFNLYDNKHEINSNDDCENYANANILEEFVNEQLSLNNIDGDFDSFLFGPLPPSPIEEIVSELPMLNGVETKRENSAPVPLIFDIHKNEPSTSIIKSRSIDAEFSHNFQQHQKIGTRSVQSERRTYPSEIPVSDPYPKPLRLKTNINPNTIEKLSDISSSLPDTPLLGSRGDFPRQYSATGTKTMTQMSNSLSINMRGAGHGSSIGLGQAMAGAELLHLNGPGRGWYPRQRQFRPVSVEQLDKLASKSPVGHSQWDSREGHKPVTLPPNLTPKFFHRSPREALRRVTSLLIRKGNTNKSNKSKTVFSSSVIGPHGDISEESMTSQSKRGFFKSLWRK